MRAVLWQSRAIALALVFAAAGFCYAVGTFGIAGPGAAARAVGSSPALRFTTPPVKAVPTDFDLGDATFGSTITRYITAEGGLKPYRFTSAGPQSLTNTLAGFSTTLQLGLSGAMFGSLPGRAIDAVTKQGLPFPAHTVLGTEGFRFQAQVQDAKGSGTETRTGMFNLFLFDSGPFRFAMDKLPDARLAASYLAKIDVLGGMGAVRFKVLPPVADMTTGAPVPMKIEDLGVFVTPDGTVMGRPLVVGMFDVMVECKDGSGNTASSRDGLSSHQTFRLNVADEPVTSSDLTTEQCSIRGDGNSNGRDTLRYRGFLSTLGQAGSQLLNSDFDFRVGGVGFACRLDGKGQFAGINPLDNSKVKIKVNSAKGTVDVTISGGSFTAGLEAFDLTDGLTRRPVQVTVGDAVAASEVLDFETRVSGARYQLEYRLGRAGVSAAGAFQIVSVKGKDDTTLSGQPGDAWRTGFIAVPRNRVTDPQGRRQGLDNIGSATVRIGSNFVQTITGAPLHPGRRGIRFGGTQGEGVKRLTLDLRRLFGLVETNTLSSKITQIPLASQAASVGEVFFPLGLDLVRGAGEAPFSGEHAKRIFGLKNQYRDAAPRR